MSTQTPTEERSTAIRPTYIELGVDSRGASHCWHTPSNTVHVVDAHGVRTHRFDLEDTALPSIDAYCAHVAEKRQWAYRGYAADLVSAMVVNVEGV